MKPQAQGRPGPHRDRAQRRARGDRGDEDQPHAHRLQHDHLRGARLHGRPLHGRGRDGLDRPGPADVHPRHGGDDQGEAAALRLRAACNPATSWSPTTPTSPAATSTTSPSACRSSTEGSSRAFACCMAHWPDVGGVLGGITTDIYSEGLQIPIVKYQKAGVVNQDLVDIIRMNVRIPERAMGDLRAQVTAVKTGERRFLELLDRYGRDAGAGGDRATSWTSRRRAARERTRAIPDGVYEAESFMDDDGVEIGKRDPDQGARDREGRRDDDRPHRGRPAGARVLQLRRRPRAMPARRSPTSASPRRPTTRSTRAASARSRSCSTPGTVVSAVRPAAMRWWMTFPMTVVDTIFKAMRAGDPGSDHRRRITPTSSSVCSSGISPRDGRLFHRQRRTDRAAAGARSTTRTG